MNNLIIEGKLMRTDCQRQEKEIGRRSTGVKQLVDQEHHKKGTQLSIMALSEFLAQLHNYDIEHIKHSVGFQRCKAEVPDLVRVWG